MQRCGGRTASRRGEGDCEEYKPQHQTNVVSKLLQPNSSEIVRLQKSMTSKSRLQQSGGGNSRFSAEK